MSNKGKIVSIQALRALAFLGIFLSHADAPNFKWPALGVSIFYVLSGYLMFLQYGDSEINCSVKENIQFSWGKIKKLYPLHIITMCFAIVLQIIIRIHNGLSLKGIIYLIGCTGLNVTLLQTWIPYSSINVSLNGVAWYLSVTMFLYFVFPFIKNWIKNIKNSFLTLFCVAMLIFEIIICIPFIIILGADSPIYIWFMYCFPIFRVGDFLIGCCLCKRNIETVRNDNASFGKYSIYEIGATLCTVAVFIWMKQEIANPLLLATHNWTTLYIPLAATWITLFVEKKGCITMLLTNRVTIFIGNISAYTFLIHYVITQYFGSAISFLHLELSYLENVIKILIELIITIIVTLLYMKITKKKIEF